MGFQQAGGESGRRNPIQPESAFSDLSAEDRMSSPILKLEEEGDANADYAMDDKAVEDLLDEAIGVRARP